MRTPQSMLAVACRLLLMAAGFSGIQAPAAETRSSQSQPVSLAAVTQTSARHQGAVNLGVVNWTCRGTQCSSSTPSSAVAAPVSLCQGLAREVGAIRSFKIANRPLKSNELKQCNSVVPVVAGAGSVTGKSSGAMTKPTPDPAKKAPDAKAPALASTQGPVKVAPRGTPPVAASPAPQTSRTTVTTSSAVPVLKPLVISASPLRYAGKGAVIIAAGPLRYTGRETVIFTTSPLRYAGNGTVIVAASPLRYSGRGPIEIRANALKYAGTPASR